MPCAHCLLPPHTVNSSFDNPTLVKTTQAAIEFPLLCMSNMLATLLQQGSRRPQHLLRNATPLIHEVTASAVYVVCRGAHWQACMVRHRWGHGLGLGFEGLTLRVYTPNIGCRGAHWQKRDGATQVWIASGSAFLRDACDAVL
jgi:hypothetical protein